MDLTQEELLREVNRLLLESQAELDASVTQIRKEFESEIDSRIDGCLRQQELTLKRIADDEARADKVRVDTQLRSGILTCRQMALKVASIQKSLNMKRDAAKKSGMPKISSSRSDDAPAIRTGNTGNIQVTSQGQSI